MEQELDPQMIEGLQSQERPIPGESLTNDPENPRPFEQAPKFTDVNKAQEEIFAKLIEEENYVPIMKLVDNGEATIMEVTQNLLYAGFREGQWNPDLMLMLAEPTAYMVMALAERAGMDYEIDNEPDDVDPKQALSEMSETIKKKAPEEKKVDTTAIADSVVKKLDTAPTGSLLDNPSEPEAPTDSLIEKPNG